MSKKQEFVKVWREAWKASSEMADRLIENSNRIDDFLGREFENANKDNFDLGSARAIYFYFTGLKQETGEVTDETINEAYKKSLELIKSKKEPKKEDKKKEVKEDK